jgi:hypothetical protein
MLCTFYFYANNINGQSYMNSSTKKLNHNLLPKIVISFNEDWEVDNWYKTVTLIPKYGLRGGKAKWGLGLIPEDIPGVIGNAKDKDDANALIREHLRSELKKPSFKQIMEEATIKAQSRWNEVKNDYFPLLSETLEVPLERFEKEYFAYFTYSSRYPFGKRAFMFGKVGDFADIAMHEIMHIEFLKAYEEYCLQRELDNNQVSHLKEILTVLLNEKMSRLLSCPDRGYTKHQDLRVKTLEIYKSENNFVSFLDKAIDLIKTEEL